MAYISMTMIVKEMTMNNSGWQNSSKGRTEASFLKPGGFVGSLQKLSLAKGGAMLVPTFRVESVESGEYHEGESVVDFMRLETGGGRLAAKKFIETLYGGRKMTDGEAESA